jgi:flagellar motor switch protein FliN
MAQRKRAGDARTQKQGTRDEKSDGVQTWTQTLEQLWLRMACKVFEGVAGIRFEVGVMTEAESTRSLSVWSEFSVGGDFRGRLFFGIPTSSREFAALLLPEKAGDSEEKSWDELSQKIANQWLDEVREDTGLVCTVELLGRRDQPSEAGLFCTLNSSRINLPLCLSIQGDLVKPSLPAKRAKSQNNDSAPSRQETGKPEFDGDEGNLDLLLDIELQASLRFGGREMSLHEILDLGPGDVVPLDRTVHAPVDLVVGDRIVARGEVVLVDGNYGLRVTEVAEPRKRLETVRCLF